MLHLVSNCALVIGILYSQKYSLPTLTPISSSNDGGLVDYVTYVHALVVSAFS